MSDPGVSQAAPGRRLVPSLPGSVWRVLAVDGFSAAGTGLTQPFLLIYLSQVRGIDLSVAGLAFAMIPLASFVGNPLGGWLADRTGARRALAAGLATAGAGAVAVTLVGEAWHAFLAAGLVGLGAAITWPAQDALLATLVTPAQRSSVFSVSHATFNAGLGLGALVAATIVDVSDPGSFELLYLLDAATYWIAIPLILRLPAGAQPDVPAEEAGEDEPGPAGGYRVVFRDRTFVRLWLLTALVVAAGYGQLHSGFTAFAARPGGISAGAVGIAFAANTITVVAAQLVVLRLVDGWRRTRALQLACGTWALSWALTIAAGQAGSGSAAVAGFVAAMVVFGLAETLVSPSLVPIVNDLAPDALRGRYNGASTLAWTTGLLTGPALAGVALDAGAGTALFAGLIVACALAATAAARLDRHLPADANRVSL